ncbi:hypothetical protein INR49_016666 [Caranx melampygus]|nr:hypothetical protein INR49_016666 [Caranx melampygus]
MGRSRSRTPQGEREDGLALPHGNVSEGEGRGIALVLVTGTETDAEVAHDLLTGGVQAEDMQGKTEEEIEMMKMMGFGSFDTTKVRVQGCPLFCSHKEVQCISLHSPAQLKRGTRAFVFCEPAQCTSVSIMK